MITITRYMDQFGLRHDNTYQDFPGLFTLYPKTVFCPLNYNNAETCFSADTVAIHHFAGSWLPEDQKIRNKHPKLFKYWYWCVFLPKYEWKKYFGRKGE